jgi:hypothetical protein
VPVLIEIRVVEVTVQRTVDHGDESCVTVVIADVKEFRHGQWLVSGVAGTLSILPDRHGLGNDGAESTSRTAGAIVAIAEV